MAEMAAWHAPHGYSRTEHGYTVAPNYVATVVPNMATVAPISGSDLPYMARTDLHGYIHIELMAPIYMATVALLPKHDHAYAAHTV